MQLPISEELKLLLNPYMFVLKEDTEDAAEPQTYSLQMLQVGHIETLKSPDQIHLFPLLNATEQQILANKDSGC